MAVIRTHQRQATTEHGSGRSVPSEAVTCPFTVIRDDRESRAGWDFSGMIERVKKRDYSVIVPMRTERLETGDYTVAGYKDLVAIERKSFDDVVASIVGNRSDPERRERFKDEHRRLQEIISRGGFAYVVIEAGLSEVWESPPIGSSVSPNSILGTYYSWTAKYGVSWTWAGDRRSAEIEAYWRLKTAYRILEDRNQRRLF